MHAFRSSVTTRRNVLTTLATGTAAFVVPHAWPQAAMQQKPASEANARRTSIHSEIDFKASPQRFYAAILDPKQFAEFTGMAAEIDAKAGGAFSLFNGMITGRNVELVENQRIVQAWRPSSWDAGVYSIVHFELKPRGAECTLIFDHAGFAPGLFDHLDAGWKGHYWELLKKYFV